METKNIPSGETVTATALPDGTFRQCPACLEDVEPGTQATRNQFRVMMHSVCPPSPPPRARAQVPARTQTSATSTASTEPQPQVTPPAQGEPSSDDPDFGDQVADEFDRQRGKGDPVDLALELGRSLASSPIAHAHVPPASRDLGDLVCEALGWTEPPSK